MTQESSTQSVSQKQTRFVPTVHWSLVFEKSFCSLEINKETTCQLVGAISFQNLSLFSSQEGSFSRCDLEPLDAIHEKILMQKGIHCTLGDLTSRTVRTRICVELLPELFDIENRQEVQWQGIGSPKLISWLCDYQKKMRSDKNNTECRVSLNRFSVNIDTFEEKRIKYRVALAAARGVAISDVPLSHINEQISRELANSKTRFKKG